MQRKPNCTCELCGKPIYRRPVEIERGSVYCSRACFGKSCRQHKRCPVCGKELVNSHNKKTCSRACANKQRKGTVYSGFRIKDKVKTVRLLKNRLISLRGGQCEKCGYSKVHILVVHHKIRRCDGGTNDLENLELICPNCHAEIHYGEQEIIF